MFGRERRRNGMNCWRLAKELSVGRGWRVLAGPGVEKRRSCVSDVEVDVVRLFVVAVVVEEVVW